MTRTLDISFGEDTATFFDRTIDAARRAEAGEDVNESHISFESWETMAAILTSRRLALLRLVHRDGTSDPALLAAAVEASRSEVLEDIEALKLAGLLDEDDEKGLVADYDEIRAVIAL